MARDEMGWPVRIYGGERCCARALCTKGRLSQEYIKAYRAQVERPDFRYPPSDEFRINGYCSCDCEDMDELERELALLRPLVEAVEALPLEPDGRHGWGLRYHPAHILFSEWITKLGEARAKYRADFPRREPA